MNYSAKMKVHPFRLNFMGELQHLEKPFVEYFFLSTLPLVRFNLILGCVFYAGFGLLDYLVFPMQCRTTLLIRLAVVCPILIVARIFVDTSFFKKYFEWIIPALVLLACYSILWMLVVIPPPFQEHYQYGIIIVIIWGFTFVRIRFTKALLMTVIVIISYELLACFKLHLPQDIFIAINFFFITPILFVLTGCYFIEYSNRRSFYLNYLLAGEQAKVKTINDELEQRVQRRTNELEEINKNLQTEIYERKQAESSRNELIKSEHNARKLAEALTDVTLALTSQIDLDKTLDEILTQLERILPYDTAQIVLLENQKLEVVRTRTSSDYKSRKNSLVPDGDAFTTAGNTLDEAKTGNENTNQNLVQAGKKSCTLLVLPMYFHDQYIGNLRLEIRDPAQIPSEKFDQFQPILNAAAVAIENARLLTTSQAQAKHFETIQQLSKELIAVHDLDKLLHQIVEKAIRLMHGKFGGIYLHRPELNALEWVLSVGQKMSASGITLKRGEGLAGRIWQTGLPLWVENYDQWEGKSRHWRNAASAVIGVPIEWRGEFLGVLDIMADPAHQQNYTVKDAEVLSQFASFSAIAIKNARFILENQHEIAERKRVEKDLRKYTQALELANKEMQELLFISSHHLQEPLRQIQTLGTRLSAKIFQHVGDKEQDYLVRIQYAAGRLQTYLKALLEYSRITINALPFTTVDLNKTLEEVRLNFKDQIEELNAVLEIHPLPVIDADPVLMFKLFQHLIDNSLKFRRTDTQVHIKVKAATTKIMNTIIEEEEFCQISLIDNGIGFDDKYSERIFRIFQKLHPSRNYSGIGVGLAVCHKIVQFHDGTISAMSQPETGAVFVISLPVKQRRDGYLFKSVDRF